MDDRKKLQEEKRAVRGRTLSISKALIRATRARKLHPCPRCGVQIATAEEQVSHARAHHALARAVAMEARVKAASKP